MSSIPKIAIVGRPNVGKSALFNRICKQRIAIVDEAEGVTRDRLIQQTTFFGRLIEIMDTGGIIPDTTDFLEDAICRQAEIAIREADSLILVVDAQAGIVPLDQKVVQLLYSSGKPITLAVNKIDHPDKGVLVHEFHALGVSEVVGVSALHDWQIVELLEKALAPLSQSEKNEEKERPVHIAIVGRPNVGKSSLVNGLLSEERCMVSPLPGTTRDSIDITFSYQEKNYTLIDTAGIRRKGAEHEVVDKFAAIRTERSIARADVCAMLVDAEQKLTAQDKRILSQIEKAGKGCLLLVNKWDLVKGVRMEHYIQSLMHEAPFLRQHSLVCISATTGRNMEKMFAAIDAIYASSRLRIPTSALNTFLEATIQKYPPPVIMGRRLRIYYLTQMDIHPPTFLLFVNAPQLMTETYKKYLLNRFREAYPFSGVPLVFHMRGKKQTPHHTQTK